MVLFYSLGPKPKELLDEVAEINRDIKENGAKKIDICPVRILFFLHKLFIMTDPFLGKFQMNIF